MLEVTSPVFSVASLFAEREAKQRKDREAEEQLRRKKEEELAAFKKRLDEFQLTEDRVQAVLARIKRAFEDGESELMLTSFPSSFCTDSGRAVNNPERPGKGKPEKRASRSGSRRCQPGRARSTNIGRRI